MPFLLCVVWRGARLAVRVLRCEREVRPLRDELRLSRRLSRVELSMVGPSKRDETSHACTSIHNDMAPSPCGLATTPYSLISFGWRCMTSIYCSMAHSVISSLCRCWFVLAFMRDWMFDKLDKYDIFLHENPIITHYYVFGALANGKEAYE